MNTRKISALGAACGALAVFAGCVSEPESHLVTAPPPPPPTAAPGTVPSPAYAQPQTVYVAPAQQVVTTTTPATVTTPATINSYVVASAPPAPQPEAVPARPSSDHVWIAGYWTWQNQRYAWMAGHWEVPPYSGAAWVNPRWEPESGAFRFYEGHWN